MDQGITIVIPAFNEERRLPGALDQLVRELPQVAGDRWEIVVSDDGSVDGTSAMLDRWEDGDRLRRVSARTNRGKGAALVAGTMAARQPLVAFIDADLPVQVSTIVDMAERCAEADLVVGSRRLPGASFNPPQPFARRLGGRCFRLAVDLFGYDVTSDPQCGAKVLRRERFEPVLTEITTQGFAFDVELIVRARHAGLRVAELPVTWRHVEGSSLRPVRDALHTLRDLSRLRSSLATAAVAVP